MSYVNIATRELAELKAKSQSHGLQSHGVASAAVNFLRAVELCEQLVRSLAEVERAKSSLEYAIEYQSPERVDELYAAAAVHEATLAAGGTPERRALREEELPDAFVS